MKPLFIANWKMHKTIAESVQYAEQLNALISAKNVDYVICPPYTALHSVRAVLGSMIGLGAQNVHWEEKGAFTGEISPLFLKDVGCDWVLIGHSERRHVFGETLEVIAKKVSSCLKQGLKTVLCVGETLAQREAGQTWHVIENQLKTALEGIVPEKYSSLLTVAYEPVWAIGTGKVATPEQAEEVHVKISAWLQEKSWPQTVRLLYGGSVKADNIASLVAQPHIQGALIGGASLEVASFLEIIEKGKR